MKANGYKKGTAKIAPSKDDEYADHPYNAKEGEVFLPHSCDDWCIGDKDNVKLMIEDLQNLLKEMK